VDALLPRSTFVPAEVASRWAWPAVLLAGLLLAAVAVAIRPDVAGASIALSGLLPVVAIAVGLRWRHPVRPGPWRFLAAGLALYWLGSTAALAGLLARDDLLTQGITVAGYTAMLGGIVGILSEGSADGDLPTLLEALILATAAALVVWFVVIVPVRQERAGVGVGDALGALAYPAIDLAMFALAGRTLLRYRRLAPSLWLMIPALVATAATDAGGLLAFANHTAAEPWLALGGSGVANAFVAAGALHPSLSGPLLSAPRPIARYLRIRIALVGAATFIAPGLILLNETGAGAVGVHVMTPELGIGALVVSALVVGYLYLLLSRLSGALHTRLTLERELTRQAQSDSLTDLPNRAAFVSRLDDVLTLDRSQVALLFCDLDDFKTVNDTLGHGAGDELLIEVGHRLRGAIRSTDLAARLGGDEFAVLLMGLAQRDDADRVAERVMQAFAAPFSIGGQQFGVRISIGIAFGADSAGVSELMRDADIAMYQAKGHGKGRFERFRPGALAGNGSLLAMQSMLEQAISSGALTVAYQPMHDLGTRRVVGFEALARWDHPELGSMAPVDFIRLAERTGLIVPLGRHVMRLACEQLRRWLDAGASADLDMFVNVSAVQLADADFAVELGRAIRAASVPPDRIVVEVTETALVDTADALATFSAVKALGVRIAIDDFGTGYSSISYIGRFPVDILKIDRSFVAALGETQKGDSLVRMIVALASSLSLNTVAEGIETDAQLDTLAAMGCRLGQGFLLSSPMPADEAQRFMPRAADRRSPAAVLEGSAA
jgi:diguanylate cyclase (GGDEF)-like protein